MHSNLPHRYVFVFWQSLQDTSLPLAELQAVIHHLYPDLVVELAYLDTILDESFQGNVPSRYAALAPLRQSAIVASTKTIDPASIVARCGYVHSGGPLVLANQWRKVDSGVIRKYCRSYLAQIESTGAELVWYQKSEEKQTHKQLQALLIDDSRYHLGDLPFKPEAKKIGEALQGRPSESNTLLYAYRDQAKSAADTRVLYLDYPERELEDFLVIYRTDAKNENPIHDLDQDEECKPFWAGIFNTPHRLINALLNLADVGNDKEVVDPFSYSGTVAIETASLGGTAQSFDISEVLGAQVVLSVLSKEIQRLLADKMGECSEISQRRDRDHDHLAISAAEQMMQALGVRVVIMGHTHLEKEVSISLSQGGLGVYANTGTWASRMFLDPALLSEDRLEDFKQLLDRLIGNRELLTSTPFFADVRLDDAGRVIADDQRAPPSVLRAYAEKDLFP